MANNIILLLIMLSFLGMGLWTAIDPASYLRHLSKANPRINPSDSRQRFIVRFIGVWFILFVAMITARTLRW